MLARGGKVVKLYVALSGRARSIEEDLKELARITGHRLVGFRAHEISELFRR